MEKYISAEAAAENLRNYKIERDLMVSHNDTIDFAISVISAEVHAADVVSRDCYDRILAENDIMREMLAQIGKKPGDKMDDVRPAIYGEWEYVSFMTVRCSNCKEIFHELEADYFCPNCGADMRETGR